MSKSRARFFAEIARSASSLDTLVTDTSALSSLAASQSDLDALIASKADIDSLVANRSGLEGLLGTSSVILPAGTTAQRPASPSQGMVRFNTTDEVYEGYNGTEWTILSEVIRIAVEYLAVGGGGAGGGSQNAASSPGYGGQTVVASTQIKTGTYTITVGAGGAGNFWGYAPKAGSNSVISGGDINIVAQGGEGGTARLYSGASYSIAGESGYSGGPVTTTFPTGTSATYGSTGPSNMGLDAGSSNGAANTGNGGSGSWSNSNRAGGSGGSGRIILKLDASYTVTFSAGVSYSTASYGTDTIYYVNAAGASDTVTFA